MKVKVKKYFYRGYIEINEFDITKHHSFKTEDYQKYLIVCFTTLLKLEWIFTEFKMIFCFDNYRFVTCIMPQKVLQKQNLRNGYTVRLESVVTVWRVDLRNYMD